MRKFPEPIQNLVSALTRLPGVGPKTALRYVYALLKFSKNDLAILANLIQQLGERIEVCQECYTYTEGGTCEICVDPKRDQALLCVVEASRDISTIEATNTYNGRYFVLGGTLNPIEGMTPDTLNTRELMNRIHPSNGEKEILLAFSPDIHGETTMMYLTKQIAPLGHKVTKLARGLPIGASLEYADEVTLGDAIKWRKES